MRDYFGQIDVGTKYRVIGKVSGNVSLYVFEKTETTEDRRFNSKIFSPKSRAGEKQFTHDDDYVEIFDGNNRKESVNRQVQVQSQNG
jgi:hypothetical protein